MTVYRETTIRKEINYKTTSRNGGFITYWKLYFNFIPTYHQAVKHLPVIKKVWAWVTFFFKTFWWLLIKPFGAVYKRKRIMTGKYLMVNDRLIPDQTKINKTNIHYIFLIPVFANPWYLTEEDWDDILK